MLGNIRNENSKLRNLLYVLLSNLVIMLSGVMMAFLIPMVTTIEDYGTFRLFLLYLNYASILTLGFAEGISIYYGKFEYSDLPKRNFSFYFRFFLVFELIFIVSLFFLTSKSSLFNNNLLLSLFIFVNCLILNVSNFCNYINMVTKRFNIFLWSNLLSKFLLIVLILFALVMEIQSYVYFIIIVTFSNLVLMLFNLARVKDILFISVGNFGDYISDIKRIFRYGFPTMLAFIVGMICYGLGQFIVEENFTKIEFAQYAFACSILTLINLVISSLGTVLFPYIARAKKSDLGKLYKNIQTVLVILFGGMMSAYYLIQFVVDIVLPEYSKSLIYLAILFPIILFDSIIRIILINYFKALRLQKVYLLVNFLALFIFILLLGLITMYTHSVLFIAIATVVSYFIWMLIGSIYFSKYFSVNLIRNIIYQIILVAIFTIINNYFRINYLESFSFYILLFLCITIVTYPREIMMYISKKKIIQN